MLTAHIWKLSKYVEKNEHGVENILLNLMNFVSFTDYILRMDNKNN